uniref:Tetratricopeptide repeat domain 6 n=1 Tax=Varanus komodoensis TaxID=61221 RepID=A0A8D2L8S0_VARKO
TMRYYNLAHNVFIFKYFTGPLECSLVQEALVHSFCQNHKKAVECALAVTKKQPESSSMFVLLGKIQMKAKKHKVKEILLHSPPSTFETAEIYFFMGQCYMEQICLLETYKQAVEDLTTAIDLDNACVLAYYNRAISFHKLKDWKNALKDYGIVLLLETSNDTFLKVLINRALLYIELDQHDNALEDFKEVAQSKPKDRQLLQVIGLCYHRLKKYEEAVHSYSKLLKLDPFFLDGYIGRANSYMEFGHQEATKQALKDFLKAIHLDPTCIKARLCLGYNLQALAKFQKAWTQFTVAILIDPKCHLAYDGRAIVCLQMGDNFAAFQDTNAALKITTNAELLTNRGVINQFMGFLNCAMKDYQQAITIDPNYALAYFNAANIYLLNRQFSQANKYYSQALRLDPKNESAFLNRAITNTLLKNFEDAKEDFEKAVCLSPFSAAIYFNKANLYSTLQQYEQAEEDISKALSIQPYDALMYKLRADIRGKLGLIKEAIADYKKAISLQELISTG